MKIIIPGTLPSLNEYVRACRGSAHTGNRMSRDAHYLCKLGMLKYHGQHIGRARMTFIWVEKNRRRDKDNVAFGKKFILDSLQEMEVLSNDGWKEIVSFEDRFEVDKKNPHVEVIVEEVKE